MDLSFTPTRAIRPDEETLASARAVCARLLQQPDLFASSFRENFRASVLVGPAPDEATCALGLHLAEAVVSAVVMEYDPEALEASWATAGGLRAAQLPSEDLIGVTVKALVRSIRDVCSEDWSSAMGSQWAGMQMWLTPHLTAGAYRARATGHGAPVQPGPPAPAAPEASDEAFWTPEAAAARGGVDAASRHDRKRRGGVRRSSTSDGDEWLP